MTRRTADTLSEASALDQAYSLVSDMESSIHDIMGCAQTLFLVLDSHRAGQLEPGLQGPLDWIADRLIKSANELANEWEEARKGVSDARKSGV